MRRHTTIAQVQTNILRIVAFFLLSSPLMAQIEETSAAELLENLGTSKVTGLSIALFGKPDHTRIYFVVDESLEYFGFVQVKLITALLVSAIVAATVVAELLKTGDTPSW